MAKWERRHRSIGQEERIIDEGTCRPGSGWVDKADKGDEIQYFDPDT